METHAPELKRAAPAAIEDREPAAGLVTGLIGELGRGGESALEKLLPAIYGELHGLAEACFRGERDGHTLQPTALVNELYLRLVDARFRGFETHRHFTAMAATLMRRILVDHARRRAASKRGGERQTLEEPMAAAEMFDADTLALDEVLQRLDKLDPDLSRVVELRYFVGLSVSETAAVLAVSEPTVKRRWGAARAWLCRELRKTSGAL